MRAYRNLLKHLSETDPGTLAALPYPFVLAQAHWLLQHEDIYVLEQVDKHVPVLGDLPQAALAAAARSALVRGAVDDFCFLYPRLAPERRPSAACVETACGRLARRGNAAGIEQIIAATGVRPLLDEATVLRSYDVLVSAGRLGAVDYIRQLSGVPVRFDPEAVATGVRTLLAGGRYAALRKLAHKADGQVPLHPRDLGRAVRHAMDDGTLCELADALLALGTAPRHEGFAAGFDRLVAEERFTEIPALFVVYADADLAALDDGMWTRLISSGSPDTVRFAFEHCDRRAWLARHAETAYRVGVASRDLALVRLACQRGAAGLRPQDAAELLDDALEHGDLAWVDFAAGQLDRLPAPAADRAQLHLARLARHRPERVAPDAALLGVVPDQVLGGALLALADGRFEDAAAAVARVSETFAAAGDTAGHGGEGGSGGPGGPMGEGGRVRPGEHVGEGGHTGPVGPVGAGGVDAAGHRGARGGAGPGGGGRP